MVDALAMTIGENRNDIFVPIYSRMENCTHLPCMLSSSVASLILPSTGKNVVRILIDKDSTVHFYGSNFIKLF
ncbi:hypothetical protein PR202_ga24995 [Eleusine coracana subsp. coracana]|uniref:Uncharacterized protein n=1 Tax=Eleusine coracana subsp. coracana TaxID=191504 RepID=A0AAV5D9H3_ELECO|nr:hypothetical protein PR202_ga24995 [Eleusine coracana subsp. coracana]